MYAYTHDPQTGGLLLNDSPSQLSKEPRPVYYRELDILGFDAHYSYVKQDELPYMWAEANCYWYRGRMVAKTKGGSLYTAPELEFVIGEDGERVLTDGEMLLPVDIPAMVGKNRELLEIIEQVTIKKIFDAYRRYHKKLDCFHVAFSGGKDSVVLLDLVKKALPKSGFIVVFGDTGMEFPDTYDVVDKIDKQCRAEEIEFYRAASHLKPEESWRLFGPPSRVLRWCCSVHKSAPQTLKIRDVLGKKNYVGMDYVGVRIHESVTRADYDYESYGKKQKGQRSFNAILEWTSAEIWLYTYTNKLIINKAYKAGNQRAGCLFCPMSAKTDYLKNLIYRTEIGKFIDIVKEHYDEEDITNGYWCARSNGTHLQVNEEKCREYVEDDNFVIEVKNPNTDWRKWIVTLGEIPFKYTIENTANGYIVRISDRVLKDNPLIVGLLKKIFHKTAYCIGCRLCEINCRRGCISFKNGLSIQDCICCQECNHLDGGCIAYNSRRYPIQGAKKMKTSIDFFGTHAPKTEWLHDFFTRKNDFMRENSLGPEQKTRFKRFLKAADLTNDDFFSPFAEKLLNIGWDSEAGLGLLLVNIVYNPQINWYISNLDIDRVYVRKEVVDLIIGDGNSEITAKIVASAFKRLCELPFGTKLNFGMVTEKGGRIETLARCKSTLTDSRVVLYSLYKFAEACDGYYQFTLTRLLNHTIESAGISPTRIFGFDRDDMERFLNGLSAKYPEFINATFTHDLDKITLREDKTSADVLTLF